MAFNFYEHIASWARLAMVPSMGIEHYNNIGLTKIKYFQGFVTRKRDNLPNLHTEKEKGL